MAVNDITDNATLAHLLEFDTILGRLPDEVSLEGEEEITVAAPVKIKASTGQGGTGRDAAGDLVDVVVESTGISPRPTRPSATWRRAPRR